MSWGERSCKWVSREDKDCKPTIMSCNVSCKLYTYDGKTQPDSVPNHGIDNMLDQMEVEPISNEKLDRMLKKIYDMENKGK